MARIDYLDDPAAPAATTIVPSANVVVTNDAGEILLIRRSDNENWALPGGAMGFLIVVNVLVFILGMFIDFFEIAFIVIPMLAPVAEKILPELLPGAPVDAVMIWFGVIVGLIALAVVSRRLGALPAAGEVPAPALADLEERDLQPKT